MQLPQKISEIYQNKRLKSEIFKTLIVLLIFAVVSLTMAMIQLRGDSLHGSKVRNILLDKTKSKSTDDIEVRTNRSDPLEIIAIHDFLIDESMKIDDDSYFNPDIALHSFLVISLFSAIIYFRKTPYKTLSLFRRVGLLVSFGYFLRTLCLASTVLPPSNPSCIVKERGVLESLLEAPKLLFGHIHTCTDKLFSGHTTVAMALLWSWVDTCNLAGHKNPFYPVKLYAYIHVLYMIITSILGWNHYTVDIILSAIINTLSYKLYLKNLKYEKGRGISPIVHWIESVEFINDDYVNVEVEGGGYVFDNFNNDFDIENNAEFDKNNIKLTMSEV